MSIGNGSIRIPLGISDLPSHRLFDQDPPAELYHYTSLQGAFGIITSKQLRLTKIQYLNDATELRYAIELFRQSVANWHGTLNPEEHAFIHKVAHQLGSFTGTNVCVASFCADGDLLSQWRAYGAGAQGVALGFSREFFRNIANHGVVRTFKCVYQRGGHETIIRELIDMALCCFKMRNVLPDDSAKQKFTDDIIGYFNTTFLRVAPVLKDWSFREEQEWRLISASIKSTWPEYGVVLLGSRLLPVYNLDFPVSADGECDVIRSARLGPMGDTDLLSNALFSLLGKHGYTNFGIQSSQIPYRTPT